MLTNYIEGRNPYKLARPSEWWLQLLFDYDPLLVVMPSVKDHAYRLCRRVPRHKQLGQLVTHLHTHPDTVQMINHGLVPMSTLTTWAIQSDKIIRDLMARDTERVGGGDKAVDIMEASERRQLAQRERHASAELDARNADAFRSLQYRKGERIAVGRPRRLDRRDHKNVTSRPTATASPQPAQGIVLTDV